MKIINNNKFGQKYLKKNMMTKTSFMELFVNSLCKNVTVILM